MRISVAIIGAAGYTGGELLRLLARHPKAELQGVYGARSVGKPVHELHPHLRGLVELTIAEPDYPRLGEGADLVFTATPHGVAMRFVPKLLEGGARVVDLSADYRFDDPAVYERYYARHESPELKAVYGLPELYAEQIKGAKLVANPGCYPTGVILALAPLLKEGLVDLKHIVVDAKSGSSGAGASPRELTHHPTLGSNLRAYSATDHRHVPEMNQELSKLAGKPVEVHFTPHLTPLVRGILSTIHLFPLKPLELGELLELYRGFYRDARFVRVLEELPQVNFVVGSNYCDLGFELDPRGERLVVVSAIDNLVKGASGQAIQNMNLMFGFDEAEGLETPPLRP